MSPAAAANLVLGYANSYCFPWCSWHSHFHVSPLAVLSNLAVAHVRSPHGKRDHAIHRLISANAAHARSPMANGDYATELLISLDAAHARSPMANGDYATELLISLDAAQRATTRLTD
jgi:hypothetical protein